MAEPVCVHHHNNLLMPFCFCIPFFLLELMPFHFCIPLFFIFSTFVCNSIQTCGVNELVISSHHTNNDDIYKSFISLRSPAFLQFFMAEASVVAPIKLLIFTLSSDFLNFPGLSVISTCP